MEPRGGGREAGAATAPHAERRSSPDWRTTVALGSVVVACVVAFALLRPRTDPVWLLVGLLVVGLLALAIAVPGINGDGWGLGSWQRYLPPVLALAVALLGVVSTAAGPVAAQDLVRASGTDRTQTSLEVSRVWIAPSRYVSVPASASGSYLSAALCAAHLDAPLIIVPEGAAPGWLGNEGVPHLRRATPVAHDGTGCAGQHRLDDAVRLDASTRDLLREAGMQTPPVVGREAPDTALVVVAARSRDGTAADVAVSLPVAAHLAGSRDEGVLHFVADPYLIRDKGYSSRLAAVTTLVWGGLIVGGETALADHSAAALRQNLTGMGWRGGIARLSDAVKGLDGVLQALIVVGSLLWANKAGATRDETGRTHGLFPTLGSSLLGGNDEAPKEPVSEARPGEDETGGSRRGASRGHNVGRVKRRTPPGESREDRRDRALVDVLTRAQGRGRPVRVRLRSGLELVGRVQTLDEGNARVGPLVTLTGRNPVRTAPASGSSGLRIRRDLRQSGRVVTRVIPFDAIESVVMPSAPGSEETSLW